MEVPDWIENAYELLAAGQWYLDYHSGYLYYIPRPNENLSQAEVIMPVLETLLSGSGTPLNRIHNLQFKNLVFAYATWLQASSVDESGNIHATLKPEQKGGVEKIIHRTLVARDPQAPKASLQPALGLDECSSSLYDF